MTTSIFTLTSIKRFCALEIYEKKIMTQFKEMNFLLGSKKVERDDEETMTNDVFQEDDSNELPPFNPTEDVMETSLLVRKDIDPVTVPHEVVIKLRTEESNLNDPEMEDIEDYDDDGRHFVNDESILESETDDDSSEDHDDDDFDST
ncbi:hypothetical protein C2S52_022090 [Perilla frutescens var. hirtella]|nr:hypothetical protein C2S52_022090 [Perilla frutescens var. hirtella]